jgi:uncharacterized protein (DUF58 family)
MKALLVLVIAAAVMVVALSTGWELMYRLGYVMLAAVLVSFVWAWGNVRWLRYRHEIKTTRAQVGGEIQERLTLENTSWLPKLWLEIRDHSTLLGRRGNRVLALGSHMRRVFTLVTPCHARGEFSLGPVTVVSGDPFGLFRRQRRLDIGGTVVVYPTIVPLKSFGRLPGELPGGNTLSRLTQQVTPNVAGIRDYQPGDTFRSIHWLSTARVGRLMTKEFEPDPLSDVWLILDLNAAVQVGEGQESTEEYSVSIAASLANYFIGQQREVGLVTQGRSLPADRGHRQLHKLLDSLAVVHATSSVPLEQVILSEETRFTFGSVVVVVTPSTDELWLAASRLLVARGVKVMVVLLEGSTFGGGDSSILAVSSLAATDTPVYLVKQGDDLSAALAQPSTGGGNGR